MIEDIKFRVASIDDAQDLLDIYSYYIEQTAITFEYKVPSLLDFEQRISNILQTYPYIVAQLNGKIVGYAYAGKYRVRPAFDWDAELTIYLDYNLRSKRYWA